MKLTPKPQEAVDFLRWLRQPPWLLVAISPEGEISARCCASEAEAAAWIQEHVESHNLYFCVNPVSSTDHKKPTKADVSYLEVLQVDIDPEPGKSLASDRKRILAICREAKPEASACVDSGGGFQLFWKLDKAERVGDNVTELEAYSRQLALLLRGDKACYNLDRIMRLPGTLNLPNRKKRERGRKPALARCVWKKPLTYPLSSFTRAAERDQRGSALLKLDTGNLPQVEVEDLGLPGDLLKAIRDGDASKHHGDRSTMIWQVLCVLARKHAQQVSPEMRFAMLLDRDLRWSDHVYQQARPVEYAQRQVERSIWYSEDPMLERFNRNHFIAYTGRATDVVREYRDESGRSELEEMPKGAFFDLHAHETVKVGENKDGSDKLENAARWWFRQKNARRFKRMVFKPGVEVPDAFNMWRGFSYDALPDGTCDVYLDHLRQNICAGVDEHSEWLLNWMARAVQQPGKQAESAVALKGPRGVGKSKFADTLGRLIHNHYHHVSSVGQLTGRFNSALHRCVILFADEVDWQGQGRDGEAKLKMLITEPTLMIELKGKDVFEASNCVHLIMATNAEWVAPVGPHERRFFVLRVEEGKRKDTRYFAEMQRELDGGGYEKLLWLLLQRDLKGWDHRTVPQTQEQNRQQQFTMAPCEEWWQQCLLQGRLFSFDNGAGLLHGGTQIRKEDLRESFGRWVEAERLRGRTQLAVDSAVVFGRWVQQHSGLERLRKYQMVSPSLETLRESFCKRLGLNGYDWPEEDAVEEPEPEEPAEQQEVPF